MRYNDYAPARIQLQEDKDCAVVAVSVATGEQYDAVWTCMDLMGRKKRKGTPQGIILGTLRHFHMNAVGIYDKELVMQCRTLRTLLPYLQDGNTYLIDTPGHILCIKEGVIKDWSVDKELRVDRIRQVVPMGVSEHSYKRPNQVAPWKPRAFSTCGYIHAIADRIYKLMDEPTDKAGIAEVRKLARKQCLEAGTNKNTVNVQLSKWSKIISVRIANKG